MFRGVSPERVSRSPERSEGEWAQHDMGGSGFADFDCKNSLSVRILATLFPHPGHIIDEQFVKAHKLETDYAKTIFNHRLWPALHGQNNLRRLANDLGLPFIQYYP